MKNIGEHYIFVPQDCCGEHMPSLASLRGEMVTLVGYGECDGCMRVECGESIEFEAFDDELLPSPCSPINPDLYFGDKVIAMVSHPGITNGYTYVIGDINRNGLVRVHKFNPLSNEYEALPRWYDPSCFRKA